jgi:hypothetical protein
MRIWPSRALSCTVHIDWDVLVPTVTVCGTPAEMVVVAPENITVPLAFLMVVLQTFG